MEARLVGPLSLALVPLAAVAAVAGDPGATLVLVIGSLGVIRGFAARTVREKPWAGPVRTIAWSLASATFHAWCS
jgi:hypothetical protein